MLQNMTLSLNQNIINWLVTCFSIIKHQLVRSPSHTKDTTSRRNQRREQNSVSRCGITVVALENIDGYQNGDAGGRHNL